MRKFLLVISMLLITSLVYGQGIKWYEDFDEGLAEAKRTGKPMMIDFYTEWEGWGGYYVIKIDKFVYTDSEVIKLAKEFVCVKVDADEDEETNDNYGVRAYPTVIFTNSQGKEISKIRGYKKAPVFIQSMKEALAKVPRPIAKPKIRKTSSKVLGPEDKAKTIYSLGENYEANKMYPQAIREYQKVIKEYPNTIWARKAEEQIKVIKSK